LVGWRGSVSREIGPFADQGLVVKTTASSRTTEKTGPAARERLVKTLTRLGREALAEHADWLSLRRERPIELPKMEL
jgi:hypothetical protein